MNEKMINYKNKVTGIWQANSTKRKLLFAGGAIALIVLIAVVIIASSKPSLVPLYTDLKPSETGTIKENLTARGITTEVTNDGTTILAPEDMIDTLKVELAAEGIPESGNLVDYSLFSKNAGMGMTDNEFGVIKLDAMQSELTNLIKGIEGVKDARVMISLPETGIFVSDASEQASASIVLDTDNGYKFEQSQIKALYHLVSKSIPNLPTENIVIMNQNFEYFDLENETKLSSGATISDQFSVKKEIERDIQRQVQTMLGTIMGSDKVVVSVSTDIDFSQEKSEHNLVAPVDEENMEGIAISAQRLTETFTGNENSGGIPQGEDPSDTLADQYLEAGTGNGDYEKVEETINNEVNRVRKEIVESPYKIRDIGIQVMVEPPVSDDRTSLPQERIDDITQILGTIIRTSIDKNALTEELSDEAIQDKIAVSVQEFNGKVQFSSSEEKELPNWMYVVAGILIIALIIVIILYFRTRKDNEKDITMEDVVFDIPDVTAEHETEGSLKRKQLEKLAQEKPDEFAKLLRTWLTQD